jgi:exosome complex exonuclease DIS3/RRP44
MLPKLLTENLCSLRADVDRLAFSTIWEVDKEASIINTKYCKTIIRSRRAFTYGQAQELMESQDKGSIATAWLDLLSVGRCFGRYEICEKL